MTCWRAHAGLPPCREDDVLLALPDIRDTSGYGCGEAAVRCVAGFWGAKVKRPVASPIDGTDPRSLETALRMAGLDVVSGNMDLGQLRDHTRAGRPVICLVTEPGGIGHYVTVAGVEYKWVVFQCPADGLCKQPAAVFERRWVDVDRLGTKYLRWGVAVGG